MSSSKKSGGGSSSGGGFQALNLSPPIYAGIKKLGYRTPTPVQRKSLPILLTGSDAVVMARTGSKYIVYYCCFCCWYYCLMTCLQCLHISYALFFVSLIASNIMFYSLYDAHSLVSYDHIYIYVLS